jgi:L-seryl-tRNA(Ser) seleniumtransferase
MKAGAVLAGTPSLKAASKGSVAVYERLGVKPVINGIGTVTILGGSVMSPEVVAAMDEASRCYIRPPELQEKAGAHIAKLLDVPAAMVTAGAASAITVAAAACLASGDVKYLYKLPAITGLKHEVVQQKSHRSGYEAQMLLTGARIVWVETAQEMERAINDRTAMAFFLNKNEPMGKSSGPSSSVSPAPAACPPLTTPPMFRRLALTEYVQQG